MRPRPSVFTVNFDPLPRTPTESHSEAGKNPQHRWPPFCLYVAQNSAQQQQQHEILTVLKITQVVANTQRLTGCSKTSFVYSFCQVLQACTFLFRPS